MQVRNWDSERHLGSMRSEWRFNELKMIFKSRLIEEFRTRARDNMEMITKIRLRYEVDVLVPKWKRY